MFWPNMTLHTVPRLFHKIKLKNTMKDLLTILIPTRNRAEVLHNSLRMMYDGGFSDNHFIVYDDASDNPNHTTKACSPFPTARVIKGATSVGQAEGRNVLLRACQTPFAMLMDDDTWFTQCATLPSILERDLHYEGIGRASAVCSQVVRTTDQVTVFPPVNKPKRIVSPLGMGCLVRTADILAVGGFRSFFRYRHEEPELGLRLWKEERPIVYDPSLVIAHSHTPVARSSAEYDRLSAQNLILMHALNLPGLAGLPLGIAKALKLLGRKSIHRRDVIRGLYAGVILTWRHRAEATIMGREKYLQYKAFIKGAI